MNEFDVTKYEYWPRIFDGYIRLTKAAKKEIQKDSLSVDELLARKFYRAAKGINKLVQLSKSQKVDPKWSHLPLISAQAWVLNPESIGETSEDYLNLFGESVGEDYRMVITGQVFPNGYPEGYGEYDIHVDSSCLPRRKLRQTRKEMKNFKEKEKDLTHLLIGAFYTKKTIPFDQISSLGSNIAFYGDL